MSGLFEAPKAPEPPQEGPTPEELEATRREARDRRRRSTAFAAQTLQQAPRGTTLGQA